MAIRTIFNNLPKSPPLQSLSVFDQEFADFGNWIVQPCTAVGSNNIVLTPETYVPLQTGYAYLNCYSFVQQATSTGPVFINYGSLPQLPCYYSNGTTQIGSGGFVGGQAYIVQYNPALNGNTGGFVQYGPTAAPAGGGVPTLFTAGMAVGLAISPGTPVNTQLSITALMTLLPNVTGSSNVLRTNGSYLLNTGTLGVGGLDTGSLAANTWYNVWLIDNGSFSTAVMSLPANASPQVPAQWIYQLIVGSVFIDASMNIWPFNQRGQLARWKLTSASDLTALPTIASGTAGNLTTPLWIAAQVQGGTGILGQWVPPSATSIIVMLSSGSGGSMLAPSNLYGGITNASNPPPYTCLVQTYASNLEIDLVLESNSIYWANNNSTAQIRALGYRIPVACC